MQPIYLDYNATTPVDEQVLEKMLPYFHQKFGNAASSTHSFGWVAKQAVDFAQQQVAAAIGCEPQQLVFTSGSTEAINLAIKGVFALYAPRKGKRIVTCKTEHKAVLDTCAYLEKYHQADVVYLSVDKNGLIDLDELRHAVDEQTVLVSIMHSNNETGVLQPIKKISEIVHKQGSIFMSDCTQSIGKVPIDVDELGIDLCCLSAHKFYGPKGIGALFFRRRSPRVAMEALIHGGGHQRGLRSGTLNVPLIVGMGEAIQLATENLKEYQEQTFNLRNELEQQLKSKTQLEILSGEVARLPNTSNIYFKDIDASKLIELTNGFMAVSTGSACTSASLKPSHVLQAMGFGEEVSIVRFSFGKYTTENDLATALSTLFERLQFV